MDNSGKVIFNPKIYPWGINLAAMAETFTWEQPKINRNLRVSIKNMISGETQPIEY